VNRSGRVVGETSFANAKNHDWDELQMDAKGFIYIGDIGNNMQDRNLLTIYKFHRAEIGKKNVRTERIDFFYPEQEFPPKKTERHYDAEAFFVMGDSLIVLTKDWSKPFTGYAKVHYVPNFAGRHKAEFLNAFFTRGIATIRDGVTGCAIYKNGLLILTYSAVYYLANRTDILQNIGVIQLQRFPFRRVKQFEAIAVDDNGVVYISAEKHRVLGRSKLYLWTGMEIK
jgi:hypothetical protein